jgi:hypothetical protein
MKCGTMRKDIQQLPLAKKGEWGIFRLENISGLTINDGELSLGYLDRVLGVKNSETLHEIGVGNLIHHNLRDNPHLEFSVDAFNEHTIEIGDNALASMDYSIAIGENAISNEFPESIAIGANSVANRGKQLSIGDIVWLDDKEEVPDITKSIVRQVVNVADGNLPHHAVSKKQLVEVQDNEIYPTDTQIQFIASNGSPETVNITILPSTDVITIWITATGVTKNVYAPVEIGFETGALNNFNMHCYFDIMWAAVNSKNRVSGARVLETDVRTFPTIRVDSHTSETLRTAYIRVLREINERKYKGGTIPDIDDDSIKYNVIRVGALECTGDTNSTWSSGGGSWWRDNWEIIVTVIVIIVVTVVLIVLNKEAYLLYSLIGGGSLGLVMLFASFIDFKDSESIWSLFIGKTITSNSLDTETGDIGDRTYISVLPFVNPRNNWNMRNIIHGCITFTRTNTLKP